MFSTEFSLNTYEKASLLDNVHDYKNKISYLSFILL